ALHEAIKVLDREIGVEKHQAIFAHAPSRLAWRLAIAPGARLSAYIAIDPAVWAQESDGVFFHIYAIDEGRTEDLFQKAMNPHYVSTDRRWLPVDVGLGRYGGHTIDLVLATEASAPGRPQDSSYDFALWGNPSVSYER